MTHKGCQSSGEFASINEYGVLMLSVSRSKVTRITTFVCSISGNCAGLHGLFQTYKSE